VIEIGPEQENGERAEVVRVTALSYMPRHPIRIRVRRRERRYDIDDMGEAVALAGRGAGWREAAEEAVRTLGWNINRDGVVLMQAVEGRDIDDLVRRTAEASLAVFEGVLEIT
jgi:hypothetical protein